MLVRNINVHKKFKGYNFFYDIVLLELDSAISLSSISEVELVGTPEDRSLVRAVGYGSTDKSGTASNKGRMADLVYRNFD